MEEWKATLDPKKRECIEQAEHWNRLRIQEEEEVTRRREQEQYQRQQRTITDAREKKKDERYQRSMIASFGLQEASYVIGRTPIVA